MIIDGVEVTAEGFVPLPGELANYVDYVAMHVDGDVIEVRVVMCDDGKVDVKYLLRGQKFERIRRITGYLVGTIDRWNDAKKSEERDRVKHDTRI